MSNRKFVRQPRFMKHNKTTRIPTHHVCVGVASTIGDSPSCPGRREKTLGSITVSSLRLDGGDPTRQTTETLSSRDGFWAFLIARMSARRRTIVWLFGGKESFTLIGGFGELEGGRLKLTRSQKSASSKSEDDENKKGTWKGFVSLGDGAFIIDAVVDGSRVTFVDVLNYVVSTQSDLSDMLGVPIGQDAAEPGGLSALARESAWQHDVVRSAAMSVCRMIRTHDMGTWAPTAASQASKMYRHRYLEDPIHIHGHAESLKLERQSYRGGRSESWYWGRCDRTLHKLDCNGLFCEAMSTGVYPRQILNNEIGVSVSYLASKLRAHCVIARVELNARTNEYPVLHRDRVHYARGNYITVLSTPELGRALADNEIVSVGEMCTYEGGLLFAKFASDCWNLREKARSAGLDWEAKWWKRIVNGLYGRWGQNGLSWQCSRTPPPVGGQCEWLASHEGDPHPHRHRYIGGICEERFSGGESYESFPAIASHISSYARIYMDRVRKLVNPGRVYMQYIDSIIVDDEGLLALQSRPGIMGDGLGQMRLVDSSEGASIWGPCDWTWRGETHVCGVPSDATDDGEGRFRFQRRAGGSIGDRSSSGGTVPIDTVTVSMQRTVPSGRVGRDGWVSPLVLGDGCSNGEVRNG